jgi:DNA repair photolyase
MSSGPSNHGRGAGSNPPNRFERLHVEPDADPWEPGEEEDAPRPLMTEFFRDESRSILTPIRSEDISSEVGVNPYRGCEHGCAYCYARPYHEYLGFSAGLDFESKIVVKHDAAQLLEAALSAPRYHPKKLSMSGVTDCYQPVERRLKLTRGCLEVLARFRHPVVLITKNALVTRDIDYLSELARHQAVAVYLSITTLDAKLGRVLEPRASSPRGRLAAMRQLADAGIPVGVSAAPMIPGLTDHELPEILQAVAAAGASFATYSLVRLPGAVAEVFCAWLERHAPEHKEKVLRRIRETHGGRLNNSTPRERMLGTGPQADSLRQMFRSVCRRANLSTKLPAVTAANFRRCQAGQGELF